jgi:PPK2 family polyphosphate:nucleotide phosphotransferase
VVVQLKPGSDVKLEKFDPNDLDGVDRVRAKKDIERMQRKIRRLCAYLYAENSRALLIVLQGMDTSGKDGTVRKVFTSVNPMGVEVSSFVPPSEEERDHDFLWRVYKRLPRRGNLGIFNRSHYEDILAVRVRKLAPEHVWKARYDQINAFEALISDLGTRVIKFFLHISREEQRERLLARMRDPAKRWKYQPSDLDDRKLWDDYQTAYEDVLTRCSTKTAPWQIVPANQKWYRNYVVAQRVVEVLEEMDPRIPKVKLHPKRIKID